MPVLDVQHVSKLYRTDGEAVPALQNVSLQVDAGEFVALVGRSGCGKSTLLNLCGAMDFPTSGQVLIDGVATTDLDDAALTRLRRTRVGFVFQSFQLLPTLTVVENVELPLLLAGHRRPRAAAQETLEFVEMGEYHRRHPHQLSGGQQQRVAIARALVHRPSVVLADEPIGNLDSITGAVVLDLLRRIASERQTIILMATHSRESAELADAVVHLRDGRLDAIHRRDEVRQA